MLRQLALHQLIHFLSMIFFKICISCHSLNGPFIYSFVLMTLIKQQLPWVFKYFGSGYPLCLAEFALLVHRFYIK